MSASDPDDAAGSLDEFLSYDPEAGHDFAFNPINAIIGPRPIGWISTVSPGGALNLAPYSFFNAFNYDPPIIGFASIGRKDTVENIAATGEFVWNHVSRDLAVAMNTSSSRVGPEVDEFALAGLDTMTSTVVAVPRVARSGAAFECRLCEIKQLQDAQGHPVDSWLVLGEVVMIHIARRLLTGAGFDPVRARTILRAGALAEYFEMQETARFSIPRPE
jgi:flavin reductase (DIM6/NTAB) family NADH-FMN oxidoreductase RutF